MRTYVKMSTKTYHKCWESTEIDKKVYEQVIFHQSKHVRSRQKSVPIWSRQRIQSYFNGHFSHKINYVAGTLAQLDARCTVL